LQSAPAGEVYFPGSRAVIASEDSTGLFFGDGFDLFDNLI
jgi:hypothetical protein